jgi:hypothetical protein
VGVEIIDTQLLNGALNMKMTQQDIDEQLASQRELRSDFRKRRHVLQRQIAQQGFHALPQVVNEIEELDNHIYNSESEIDRLEQISIESGNSFAEAEYILLLFKVLKTPSTRFTVDEIAHLRFSRLRLRLTSERAQELESEVRAALVKQIFLDYYVNGHRSSML